MPTLMTVVFAVALASCATEGDTIFGTGVQHTWRPVNDEGVPAANARAQCDADAKRATATTAFLSRRLAERRRLSDECMIKRGY